MGCALKVLQFTEDEGHVLQEESHSSLRNGWKVLAGGTSWRQVIAYQETHLKDRGKLLKVLPRVADTTFMIALRVLTILKDDSIVLNSPSPATLQVSYQLLVMSEFRNTRNDRAKGLFPHRDSRNMCP